MSNCPCSPDAYTLQHLGFWQYRSTGKIEENYECLKCHKFYRLLKNGEIKEILNFKGVSKNIHVPRDYKPIYRDNGKPKGDDGVNTNRNRTERYRNKKGTRVHRDYNSR